jgi:RNA polymerase sigma-70 factor (family 1)
MNCKNEKLLLQGIREGDDKAFSLFYGQYLSVVHKFVLRYVKSAELSEDLCQEIFIKIWEKRQTIPEIDSLKSYLFILARNHTFTFLKKASAEDHLKEKIIASVPCSANSTEDQIQSAEYMAHLQRILSTMPRQTQNVFELCRVEEKSYQEVSTLLGISKDAVKKHMVRSMKILKLTIQGSMDIFLSLTAIFALLHS